MKKFYLLFLLFSFFGCSVLAQDNKLISVDYKQAGIAFITADLKIKTGYIFYYNPVQFDSLKVTLTISNQTLPYILTRLFEHTPYYFSITAANEVILTRDHPIDAAPATDFLNKPDSFYVKPAQQIAPSVNIQGKPVEAVAENHLYEIGESSNRPVNGIITISGTVRDERTKEPLLRASIAPEGETNGVLTDSKGRYSINLPPGRHTLIIKAVGMRTGRRIIALHNTGLLNIALQEQLNTLKEVNISAARAANVRSTEMGAAKIDIKTIKQVPTVFGEADILRVILTLPGVQSVGEASTGFNVRGGSADQNLILLNDATIYNPSHFFGFFSAFNPDIVKDVELYKSSIPEKYGGRLSSVLDVTDREGNKQKYTGSAGIGLITSRFNIEGPLIKNRTSFIFGARTTYSDWLLNLLPAAYKNSSASFYDVNLDISHKIDNNNNLYLTTYTSRDKFRLNSDTAYSYSNKDANIKWKHNYNTKLFSVFLLGFDDYQYDISSTANPVDAYKLNFAVKQYNFKTDFNYYPDRKNTLNFGFNSIYYKLNPGSNQPNGNTSLVVPEAVPEEQALESALYLGDKFDFNPDLSIDAGVRYSLYNYLGPQTVDKYLPGVPRSASTVTDSTAYGSGKVINTYQGPEVRVSARYNLSDLTSIKASYNTLRQYIHLLSNTTAISPTDSYKLSDPNIKPQFGKQVSFGLYHNTAANALETSVEVYYKRIYNYLDYKSGATLLLNQHIERDVVSTQGKAYGIELLLKKNTGTLNGWLSYTYSRTFLRQDDPQGGPLINGGAYYPANYDKPHALNLVGNLRASQRFSVSVNVIYSTGRPITYPVTEYYYDGAVRTLYSDRNAYRIPDYFRTDLAMNIDGNHKVHQRFHNSFTIGVYNLTGRANAYSTFFSQQGGAINSYQLSIFARPIPFINYNIRF